MLNKTKITLSVAIVIGTVSCAFAAGVQEATNHASQYGSPDSTPNGPFVYVGTYGAAPTVQRQVQQPHRSSHKHN